MKFTLDAGGAQAAGQGIGNIFKAYALGDQYRQQGEMDAMTTTARLGQAQAAARNYNSEAALREQKLKTQSNPLETALLELNLPTALAPAFKTKLETGSFGPSYDTPADGVGPVMPAPADNDTVAKLGRSMALMQRMYGTGSNVQQAASASLKGQQERVIDQLVSNPASAPAVGQAYAATSGKPLFNAVGNTGVAMNQFTGQGDGMDVLRKLFGEVQGALANQRNAAAGASGASAGLSNARRERVVSGLDKPVTIVDDETGQASVTALPTRGDPRTIGLAPAKGTGADATNAKTRNAIIAAVEKDYPTYDEDQIAAEVNKRLARRGITAAGNKNPANAPSSPKISAQEASAVIAKAKAAIQNGAPRNQVIERLKQNGIDPTGL